MILAVKPWLIDQILSVIRLEPRQVLVSIAGGVTFEQLVNSVGPEQTIFRLIPNTAISERQSMTLIASRNASKEQEQLMLDIFNELGMAMLIPGSYHCIDFLRHSIRVEIYTGSYAGRH